MGAYKFRVCCLPVVACALHRPLFPSPTSKLTRTKLSRVLAKDSASRAMGKTDIESWIASTSASSPAEDKENYGGNGSSCWRRDMVLNDWQAALAAARRALLSSSTKTRIRFLQDELLYIAQHCGM